MKNLSEAELNAALFTCIDNFRILDAFSQNTYRTLTPIPYFLNVSKIREGTFSSPIPNLCGKLTVLVATYREVLLWRLEYTHVTITKRHMDGKKHILEFKAEREFLSQFVWKKGRLEDFLNKEL